MLLRLKFVLLSWLIRSFWSMMLLYLMLVKAGLYKSVVCLLLSLGAPSITYFSSKYFNSFSHHLQLIILTSVSLLGWGTLPLILLEELVL